MRGMSRDRMIRRQATGVELREDSDSTGFVRARFATLDVVDAYSTIMARGAFGEQDVLLSNYNHDVWGTGGLFSGGTPGGAPIGRGRIYESGEDAIFEGTFNLSMSTGKDTYESVKMAAELQEWSFGFYVMDYDEVEIEGVEYERFTKMDVREVSPVLAGAGVNTGTLDIRGAGGRRGLKQAVARKLMNRAELIIEDGVIDASEFETMEEAAKAVVDYILGREDKTDAASELAALRARLIMRGHEDMLE